MTTTMDGSGTRDIACPGDGFAVAFDRIAAELEGLGELAAWMLSEEAVQARLTDVLRLRARLEEVTVRLLGSVMDREIPRVAGASSPKAWLRGAHGISGPDAARLVRETTLHTTSAADGGSGACVDGAQARSASVRAAWRLGRVSAEQAILIGQTLRKLSDDVTPSAAARLAEDLVGHAQTLTFDGLRRVCRHAAEVVDPDGADRRLAESLAREEKRALAGAELRFRPSGDGWTGFSGRLPDSYADLWKKALDGFTNPRRTRARSDAGAGNGADAGAGTGAGAGAGTGAGAGASADAGAGESACSGTGTDGAAEQPTLPIVGAPAGWDLAGPGCPRHDPDSPGTEPMTGDPARGIDGADPKTMTYPQRLGRAWCALLEHLPVDGLPKHGATPASVMITISLDQLTSGLGEATTDTGTPMSPGQVRRLACNSALIPIVLGADSAILDLGLTRRLFDRYQRLALAVRDGGCIWPACDKPPAWTEAHHITFWTDGGPTDLANGCLLCPYHHHLIHGTDGWQIRMAPDGVPEVIPPTRIDPTQTPRRHERLTRLPERC